MDLQTRKLNLISYLADLQDENFIEKIEKFIRSKKPTESERRLKPFTERELVNRAKKANSDFEKGKTLSQDKLEEISSNW